MNPADIFVIVIVVLSALVGLMRGFIREVLSVASWVAAGFVTYKTFEWSRIVARDLLSSLPVGPTIADIAGPTVVFIVTLIACSVVSHFIASMVTGGILGAVDRSLGFVFGVGRGLLLVGLAFLAFNWFVPAQQRPPWIDTARSLPLVNAIAEYLQQIAPEGFRGPQRPAEDETTRRARQAEDAERALRALANPANTANRGARGNENGYNSGDRRQVDRLIQAQPGPQGQTSR